MYTTSAAVIGHDQDPSRASAPAVNVVGGRCRRWKAFQRVAVADSPLGVMAYQMFPTPLPRMRPEAPVAREEVEGPPIHGALGAAPSLRTMVPTRPVTPWPTATSRTLASAGASR